MNQHKRDCRLMYIFFLAILLCNACRSTSEAEYRLPVPELSRQAMYCDFDTLVSIITEVNPQLAIRKKVNRLDILRRLEELSPAIDTCTTSQFYDLVNQAMYICQDGHAGILPSFYFKNPELIRLPTSDTPSSQALHNTQIYLSFLDSIRDLKKLNLPIKYFDGEYFVTASFEYQDQLFEEGAKLMRCNGQGVHDVVQSLVGHKFLRWDYKYQRFYHEDFLSADCLVRNQRISLSFQTPDGKRKEQVFDLYDSLTISMKEIPHGKNVFYQDSLHFLYIRVPVMDIRDTTFYIHEISKYRDYRIDKVAIDIRDNRGGSDLVGEKIIEMLIDDWFYTEIMLLAHLSPKVAQYLDEDLSIAEIIEPPFADSTKYWKIFNFYKNVFPDARSIHYDGPIYIMQNENIFSAAGTLAAYAEYSDRIFSVGSPTGRLLGKGTTPMIFELPNSHLLFRLEPLIDFSNATTAEEVFHDQVEMPVLTPPEDHEGKFTSQDKVLSEDYLIKHDPLVKAVLNHAYY